MPVTAAEVRRQIKAGDTAPLYLLQGDDLRSSHELAVEFAAVIDEGLQAFNVQGFHANQATTAGQRDQLIGELLAAARTLPMMSPRRVILVHQAEALLSPRKARDEPEAAPPDTARKRGRTSTPAEELEQYLEAPERLTTVVFVAGDLDGNRRLVKLVRQHAVNVDCGSLESDAEAKQWTAAWCQQKGRTIAPAAVAALVETCGRHRGRLRGELEKVLLFAGSEAEISAAHVRAVVMPQSEPGEDFALGRAIWANNAKAALRELAALSDAGVPAFLVLGQIRAAVGRLQPDARVRPALDAVFRTDLAIKSSVGEPQFQLERLIVELLTRR
ncbi:MAG: DNA polymerase III subunit delta [Acidobacteriota bacterium]